MQLVFNIQNSCWSHWSNNDKKRGLKFQYHLKKKCHLWFHFLYVFINIKTSFTQTKFSVIFTKTVSQSKGIQSSLSISSRIAPKPWPQLLLEQVNFIKKASQCWTYKAYPQFNLPREWRTTESFLRVYQQQKEDKGKCRSFAEWERTQKRPRYSPPSSPLSLLVRLTINNSKPLRSDGKSGARNTPYQ